MSMQDFDAETAAVKRKETATQRQKRLVVAVSEVLSSESGRLVLSEILGFCQVDLMNGQDGMAAGRIEGARSVGLRTVDLLRSSDFAGWMKLYGELYHER